MSAFNIYSLPTVKLLISFIFFLGLLGPGVVFYIGIRFWRFDSSNQL